MKSVLYVAVSALFLFSLLGCQKNKINDTAPIKEGEKPNSFNTSLEAGDGSYKKMAGCLGYASGFNSGSVGLTLNNPYWDQKLSEEVIIQRDFYNGIPATVCILYEPSADDKNAYATSDGKILFGFYMFYYTVRVYGELPVAGVLAHEWGHRVQYTYNWSEYYKPEQRELEADAFSGYYMALAKQYAWSQIQSYYNNVYATGDYLFNDPSHHGTPDQRLQATYLGVTTAVSAMRNNTRYSYLQLHQVFFDAIGTTISAPKENSFPDVIYPNLNKADIHKLYPRN
jgi:hypothetical protein